VTRATRPPWRVFWILCAIGAVMLAVAGCGRTPTGPKPCTAANAYRVDTVALMPVTPSSSHGLAIVYWCR